MPADPLRSTKVDLDIGFGEASGEGLGASAEPRVRSNCTWPSCFVPKECCLGMECCICMGVLVRCKGICTDFCTGAFRDPSIVKGVEERKDDVSDGVGIGSYDMRADMRGGGYG
eukprot:gnl/TRDRNA2_/TRDRNA2_177051_c7_seq1.p3 gnl/TRDRNA2_/TRDRNA2_177051_c7~~gnl/TRDRNA2_/TRDRNA2_177051_c7_seq1.p3  ORF type:complete len:114 (-),score=13.98 gnl/TRDRNA2_/TRDRNA2_177051_c7_seq1:139-480(-)